MSFGMNLWFAITRSTLSASSLGAHRIDMALHGLFVQAPIREETLVPLEHGVDLGDRAFGLLEDLAGIGALAFFVHGAFGGFEDTLAVE